MHGFLGSPVIRIIISHTYPQEIRQRGPSLGGFCSPPPTFLCVWFRLTSVFKGILWAFAISNCLRSLILPLPMEM